MTKREIKQRIYLAFQDHGWDYQVIHNMPGSTLTCITSSVKIGNAIVRALRELAYAEAAK